MGSGGVLVQFLTEHLRQMEERLGRQLVDGIDLKVEEKLVSIEPRLGDGYTADDDDSNVPRKQCTPKTMLEKNLDVSQFNCSETYL